LLCELLAFPFVVAVVVDPLNPFKTMSPSAESAQLLLRTTRTSNLDSARGGRPSDSPPQSPPETDSRTL